MELFPAIDLLDGRCVRLLQGDYERKTVYGEDPVAQARAFEAMGATRLHVVDLNAARSGGEENLPIIRRLCRETGLKIETGGGLRNQSALEKRLDCGVWRCVLGTVAVTDPDFTARAIREYGERLAIGADCREGHLALRGWTEQSELTLDELAASLRAMGARTLIYTDIARDGVLSGPNFSQGARLRREYGLEVVLSGGVASELDVAAAERLGMDGLIVGRAYYEGRVDLERCFNYLRVLGPSGAGDGAADVDAAMNVAQSLYTEDEAEAFWKPLKKDGRGLICCVTCEAEQKGAETEAGDASADSPILMQAWQDEEAFVRSLVTGRMHYHSRSRDSLWLKGETSGHYQFIQYVRVDCDADCLLYFVRQQGAACHTGHHSCFYRDLDALNLKLNND